MTLKKHFIILFSIFLGFTLDNLIIPFTNPYFIELSLGFMIFSYWVFAIPEKLHSFEALIYGAFIDLFFGEAVGFHMLFFTLISYITHVYVFRFRLFSYFQLAIFFSGATTFFIASKYLIFFPENYSYLLLILSFIINSIIWIGVYFVMRAYRRKFL